MFEYQVDVGGESAENRTNGKDVGELRCEVCNRGDEGESDEYVGRCHHAVYQSPVAVYEPRWEKNALFVTGVVAKL